MNDIGAYVIHLLFRVNCKCRYMDWNTQVYYITRLHIRFVIPHNIAFRTCCAWFYAPARGSAFATTINIDKSFTRCLVVNVVKAFAQLLTRSKRQWTLYRVLCGTFSFNYKPEQILYCRVIVRSNACNRINSTFTNYSGVSQVFELLYKNSRDFHLTC